MMNWKMVFLRGISGPIAVLLFSAVLAILLDRVALFPHFSGVAGFADVVFVVGGLCALGITFYFVMRLRELGARR